MEENKERHKLALNDGVAKLLSLEQEVRKCVLGQERVVREMLIALISGGHILIEGVPGLGKTLLAKTMAKAAGAQYTRIQFTPDLMPADITGHSMFDMQNNRFRIRKGPIFTHILLADEINRAPAKTQAALLEAMQEQQVTIEGTSLSLDRPFLVIATQNPIEQEGTYPLPRAQTDRFMFKIFIDYPQEEDERLIVRQASLAPTEDQLTARLQTPLLQPSEVLALQKLTATLTVDEQIVNYIVTIIRATRNWNGIDYGAGPRGAVNLLKAARGSAMLRSRDFITPDDVKDVALPVLRHRIKLSADMDIEGYSPDHILKEVLESVNAPRI